MTDGAAFRHDFRGTYTCKKCGQSFYAVGPSTISAADIKPLAPKGFFDDEPISVWRERVAAMNRKSP